MTEKTEKMRVAMRGESPLGSEKPELNLPVVSPDMSAAIEGLDSGEAMGNVAESASGVKEKKGAGMRSRAAAKANTVDVEALKKKLLESFPEDRELVVKQIRREIHKEIALLEKQAAGMIKSVSKNYFELSNVVKKIRTLRGILALLVRASAEKLKSLWLKFVHGIM